VVPAPDRAAGALDLAPGDLVVARRRLVVSNLGPMELGTVYIPFDLAAGTDLADPEARVDSVTGHLVERKGIILDHATERISARLPTAEEARLLEIGRRESVLTVLLIAFDIAGNPVVASDAVWPAGRRDLEDTFPIG
jgi:GntR family transcriptional regulator